jgi:hypothetical protein
MADSMPDGGTFPVVPGQDASLNSRPLQTGKTFTLVVHASRLHQLSWDTTDYAPADACRLTLAGKNLGKEPFEVSIEAEQDGVWVEVEKVQAKADSGQSTATVDWKVPVPAGHAEAVAAREAALRGDLISAVWAETEVTEGSALAAQVEAERMEGKTLVVFVERQFPDGSWRCVFHAEGEVRDGKCQVAWSPPLEADPDTGAARAAPAGSLVACKFEDGRELGSAETAWMKVNCAGLENQAVQIVLERMEGEDWSEVSSAVSTVKAGEARAGIPI